MKTISGGKAAGIARWAWEDPQARVRQAIAEVSELAASATGPELAEIQDAGTMLSRLAGTLEPEPAALTAAPDLITVQLAAGTILGQVLDLAGWHDAWRHEARGLHGEWSKNGSASALRSAEVHGPGNSPRLRAERVRRLQDAHVKRIVQQQMAEQERTQASAAANPAPVSTGNKALTISEQIKAQTARYDPQHGFDPSVPTNAPPDWKPTLDPVTWEREHEAFFQQRVKPHVEARAQAAVAEAQAKAAENTKKALDVLNAEGEAKEKHAAALKLATEGSIAIAGGIIAYVEAKLGVPDLIAIASSVGPILIQIIIEFWKRL